MMTFLKNIIFYLLLYVRPLFLFAGKMIGFALLLFSLPLFYLKVNNFAAIFCIAASFVIFILRNFYDIIILKLNPTGTILSLEQ